MIVPHVACWFADGTVSAYICELNDKETYSRWMTLLNRYEATENIQERYQEMGIDTRVYRLGHDVLHTGWSYGEYSIRGPKVLIQRLVAELLGNLA